MGPQVDMPIWHRGAGRRGGGPARPPPPPTFRGTSRHSAPFGHQSAKSCLLTRVILYIKIRNMYFNRGNVGRNRAKWGQFSSCRVNSRKSALLRWKYYHPRTTPRQNKIKKKKQNT